MIQCLRKSCHPHFFINPLWGVSTMNKFLISFDVCSLFTSIPLKGTIDLAVDLLFEHNPDVKITEDNLKKFFEFATSGKHSFRW